MTLNYKFGFDICLRYLYMNKNYAKQMRLNPAAPIKRTNAEKHWPPDIALS